MEEEELTIEDERKLFSHVVKYHNEMYYDSLFKPVIDEAPTWRGNPIRTSGGGTTAATQDNCINEPPPFPIDPDYTDRICKKGYYCNMSNRKWACIYSVPKDPNAKKGYNPK